MRWLLAIVPLLWSLSGCGPKLDMEATFDVPIHGKLHIVEPIKKEQTIKVSVTATGAPISVYVYLEQNEKAAQQEMMRGKAGGSVIAKLEKTEQANLEALIPADSAAVVAVMRASGKGANVKLKITNR